MKTIREFKNSIESHGVSINGKMPTPPAEFTNWILKELENCNKNSDQVAKKINKIFYERKNNKNINNENKINVKKSDINKNISHKSVTNKNSVHKGFMSNNSTVPLFKQYVKFLLI